MGFGVHHNNWAPVKGTVSHQAANDCLSWPAGQDGPLKRHGYPKRHRRDFLVANEHTSLCSFNGRYIYQPWPFPAKPFEGRGRARPSRRSYG